MLWCNTVLVGANPIDGARFRNLSSLAVHAYCKLVGGCQGIQNEIIILKSNGNSPSDNQAFVLPRIFYTAK